MESEYAGRKDERRSTATTSAVARGTKHNGCRVAKLEREVNLGLVIRFIAFRILIQILREWSERSGHISRVPFSQTFGFVDVVVNLLSPTLYVCRPEENMLF